MATVPAPRSSTDLRRALGETGAIGATVRQLARRLAIPPPRVEASLAQLASEGEAFRLGRGLWVLNDYRTLDERSDFADPKEFDDRFLEEHGIQLGTYRGPITFASNDSLPVHRWWPDVQGYSAQFVQGVLAEAALAPGATVLDPFAGSGTTLVETRRAGLRAIGIELLPPAALAARVKTNFELRPEALRWSARRWIDRARRGRLAPLPFLRETRRQFDPTVLRALRRLRAALPPEGRPVDNALRLVFGRALIPVSRLHRSPCLGYRRRPPEVPLDPWTYVEQTVEMLATDLTGLAAERDRFGPPAEVHAIDARQLSLPPGSVDLAVTSPPYVNGMDYVMNYKLDLAWLGYAGSYSDLSRFRTAEVACDNLRRDEAALFRSVDHVADPWLREILLGIQRNVARKGSYRRADAHAIVHRYFVDLRPVLAGVYAALAPGGRFVVVVGDSLLAGTYIPGDLLLARIGASIGFEIRSVDVARIRRSGQRRSFRLRESVVTLERPRSRRRRR